SSIAGDTSAQLYKRIPGTPELELLNAESSHSNVYVERVWPGVDLRVKSFRVAQGLVNGQPLLTVRVEVNDKNGSKIAFEHGQAKDAAAAAETGAALTEQRVAQIFEPHLIEVSLLDPHDPDSLAVYRIPKRTFTMYVDPERGNQKFFLARANHARLER